VPEILATLHPSLARRIVGVGSLFAFGAILVTVALTHPPREMGWLLFLLVLGALALVMAEKMRRDTGVHLELTADELRDSEGRLLARVADIRAIERGTFAFKPSSGFLLRLHTSGARAWAPGLWWRFGSFLGVGGITGSREGKYMAEMIAALLSERR
jgi:hypothetical protein